MPTHCNLRLTRFAPLRINTPPNAVRRTLLSAATELLKNVHALHFFTHSSTDWLVVVQDEDHRVLFIDPSDGSIVDEVTNPDDTSHSFSTGTGYADCNTYFANSGAFNPTCKPSRSVRNAPRNTCTYALDCFHT